MWVVEVGAAVLVVDFEAEVQERVVENRGREQLLNQDQVFQ